MEKCIKCGKCEKTCPKLEAGGLKKEIKKSYAAINKNGFLINESASGGIYPLLAGTFLKKGGKVFAAVYQKNFKVGIQEIKNFEMIKAGCGSKYVQSQTGDSYSKVRTLLEQGEQVLYFALPCQIAGLYKFLGRNYEGLYTVEMVCHGVPAEKLFLEYISYMEDILGSRIESIKHRYKKDRFEKIVAITLCIETVDGKKIIKDSADDPYLLAFRTGISIGSHCTSCSFSCIKRTADITIGDFLCLGTIKPFHEDISKGVSTVLANSDKGEKMLDELGENIFLEERELKECMVFNTNLWKRTEKHPLYDKFYKEVYREDFNVVRKKYMDHNRKNKIAKVVKRGARTLFGTNGVCSYMKYVAEKKGTMEEIDKVLSE